MISSQSSVLLQTAEAEISDSGSQRAYGKKLNWTPVDSKQVTINAFGDTAGKQSVCNMYKFCIKNPKWGTNLFMSSYSVPRICLQLNGQKISNIEEIIATTVIPIGVLEKSTYESESIVIGQW